MSSHDLNRMLQWDAARASEESGAKDTEALRRGLQVDHRQRMGAVLAEMGDSYFGQSWQEFACLVDELDFALIAFTPYHLNGPGEQRIWIHARGAILVADSYQGMTNQARLWACWNPANNLCTEQWPPGIIPEQLHRPYWYGDLDVREGLKTRWQSLTQNGSFLTPWPEVLRPWPFHAAEVLPRDHIQLEVMVEERLMSWHCAARKLMGYY